MRERLEAGDRIITGSVVQVEGRPGQPTLAHGIWVCPLPAGRYQLDGRDRRPERPRAG